jgi:transcriptional regulator with PAS, ATPase and Fis domain
MKPDLQVKLLRVIEQKTFERVGGTTSIPLKARIISATNQDLKKARIESRFREDLYYRLRTVPLVLPPLRERPEDIPLLIDHFIQKFNSKYNKRVRSVDPRY